MSASQPSLTDSSSKTSKYPTKVSTYDRVSALLVASVLCAAFFVTVLLVIWITDAIVLRPHQPKIFGVGGIEIGTQGLEDTMEEPAPEALADIVEPDFVRTVASIREAVVLTTATTNGLGNGPGRPGDGREGPPHTVPPIPVPMLDDVLQRWSIHFSLMGENAYAQQLDFFEIELGAIDRKHPVVKYARNLSSPNPTRRDGQRTDETRIYFVHAKEGHLTQMSRSLLNKADIETDDCYLAQFFSTTLCEQLLAIEKESLEGRNLDDVRRTVFATRRNGDAYEIYVQRFQFYPGR